MNIQLTDEDAILLLLTYIQVMILQVLQKVNKQLYTIYKPFRTEKQNIWRIYWTSI